MFRVFLNIILLPITFSTCARINMCKFFGGAPQPPLAFSGIQLYNAHSPHHFIQMLGESSREGFLKRFRLPMEGSVYTVLNILDRLPYGAPVSDTLFPTPHWAQNIYFLGIHCSESIVTVSLNHLQFLCWTYFSCSEPFE